MKEQVQCLEQMVGQTLLNINQTEKAIKENEVKAKLISDRAGSFVHKLKMYEKRLDTIRSIINQIKGEK